MPVGGAHRAIFKSSGGMSTSDTFDRADGALGSTNGGDILTWQVVKGAWSISANRPTTTDARDTNPVAVVDAATPDVSVKMDVSSGGGDALYFRVVDANNWLRMRVNNTTFSSTYSYTCAYTSSYQCAYTSSYTCYATQYCAQYATYCDPVSQTAYGTLDGSSTGTQCSCNHDHPSFTCYSTSSTQCCGGSYTHNHYTSCTNNCVTDGDPHTHTMGWSNVRTTGSYVACGTYSYTCYTTSYKTCYSTAYKTCYATAYAAEPETIVDKNVGGTVTTLATYPDNPTSLRASVMGDQITPQVNGVNKAVITDASHRSATKHGFGRGPSANNGAALDNFDLAAQ